MSERKCDDTRELCRQMTSTIDQFLNVDHETFDAFFTEFVNMNSRPIQSMLTDMTRNTIVRIYSKECATVIFECVFKELNKWEDEDVHEQMCKFIEIACGKNMLLLKSFTSFFHLCELHMLSNKNCFFILCSM